PACLDGGAEAFCLLAAFVGAARRLGRPPYGRPRRRQSHQFAQLVETILPIAFLIAETLRGEDQVSFAGDAPMLLHKQPLLDVGGQARASYDVPTKHRLGGDLVDVLSPRPAAADEAPLELVVGDGEPVIDV